MLFNHEGIFMTEVTFEYDTSQQLESNKRMLT